MPVSITLLSMSWWTTDRRCARK